MTINKDYGEITKETDTTIIEIQDSIENQELEKNENIIHNYRRS